MKKTRPRVLLRDLAPWFTCTSREGCPLGASGARVIPFRPAPCSLHVSIRHGPLWAIHRVWIRALKTALESRGEWRRGVGASGVGLAPIGSTDSSPTATCSRCRSGAGMYHRGHGAGPGLSGPANGRLPYKHVTACRPLSGRGWSVSGASGSVSASESALVVGFAPRRRRVGIGVGVVGVGVASRRVPRRRRRPRRLPVAVAVRGRLGTDHPSTGTAATLPIQEAVITCTMVWILAPP